MSDCRDADRSRALCASTHTSPRALCTTGWPRCRHNAPRFILPVRTNSCSRPRGSGTQISPLQSPSGFATQPVAASASRADIHSASPDASAAAAGHSPDSVNTVTIAHPPWLSIGSTKKSYTGGGRFGFDGLRKPERGISKLDQVLCTDGDTRLHLGLGRNDVEPALEYSAHDLVRHFRRRVPGGEALRQPLAKCLRHRPLLAGLGQAVGTVA